MNKAVKTKIHKMMVKTVVAFVIETLAVREMEMKLLNTWETKILRRINGLVVEHGI